MKTPRTMWLRGQRRSTALISGLRSARVSWYLSLASMLGFFALPALVQELYVVVRALNPDGFVTITQTHPDEIMPGRDLRWLWLFCGLCTILAALLPRWWHARVLSRIKLPTVEQNLHPSSFSYRTAPGHKIVLGRRAIDRLNSAYHGRLGITLLLLWPALSLAGYYGIFLTCSFGISGTDKCFAGPHEYLPVFVISTILLLLAWPSTRHVLGPLAPRFEHDLLEFTVDTESPHLAALRPATGGTP